MVILPAILLHSIIKNFEILRNSFVFYIFLPMCLLHRRSWQTKGLGLIKVSFTVLITGKANLFLTSEANQKSSTDMQHMWRDTFLFLKQISKWDRQIGSPSLIAWMIQNVKYSKIASLLVLIPSLFRLCFTKIVDSLQIFVLWHVSYLMFLALCLWRCISHYYLAQFWPNDRIINAELQIFAIDYTCAIEAAHF